MHGSASMERLEYKYPFLTDFMFVLETKGAGGIRKTVCRIVVVLFINLFSKFAVLPVLVSQYGGWGHWGKACMRQKPET